MKYLSIFSIFNIWIFSNSFTHINPKMNINNGSNNKHFIPDFNSDCMTIHGLVMEKLILNLNLSEIEMKDFKHNAGWGITYKNNDLSIIKKIAEINLVKYNVYNINVVTQSNTKLPHFQTSLHSFGKKIIATCDLIPKMDYFLNPEYLNMYYEEFYQIKKKYKCNLTPIEFKNIYTEAVLSPVALTYILDNKEDFVNYINLLTKYIDLYTIYLKSENDLNKKYKNLGKRDSKLKELLFENAPGVNLIKKIFIDDLETFKDFSLF